MSITWIGFRVPSRSSFEPPLITPKALGLAMSIPFISNGWEKEICMSTVFGSALDTVAFEGMSMPKWANTGPDIMKTNTAANMVILFLIGSSLMFFCRRQKK